MTLGGHPRETTLFKFAAGCAAPVEDSLEHIVVKLEVLRSKHEAQYRFRLVDLFTFYELFCRCGSEFRQIALDAKKIVHHEDVSHS